MPSLFLKLVVCFLLFLSSSLLLSPFSFPRPILSSPFLRCLPSFPFPPSPGLPRLPPGSLVASLELDSPFVRRPIIYPHSTGTPLPPIHSFALLITASKLNPLTCCSSLTSLTLWNPLPSTLSSLASSSSSSSSVRASLKSLTLHSPSSSPASHPSRPSLTSPLSPSSPASIDPFDLHAPPRPSQRWLKPPALASLALHGTTNHLFSAPPFRSPPPPLLAPPAHARTSQGCRPSALACWPPAVACTPLR
ncbi:unnamed protein product [Closterium sp. NIES-65]|nr:unnamed protein product [Closterium sp. NIES-65]